MPDNPLDPTAEAAANDHVRSRKTHLKTRPGLKKTMIYFLLEIKVTSPLYNRKDPSVNSTSTT